MNKYNVSYAQISSKLGISIATISRALNQPHLVKPETLKRVYRAIEELGGTLPDTVPPIQTGTRILAVIPVFNNPFYTEIAQGIQDAANLNGCQLLIINEMLSLANIHKLTDFISQFGISGVVIMQKLDAPVLEYLKNKTIVVQCSEYTNMEGVPYISIDNIDATNKILRYLISAGRKKIAIVNTDPCRYNYASLRLNAYIDTLETNHLTVNPAHIITVPDVRFNTALPAISALLKSSEVPDAIFCVSDTIAAAALRACAIEDYQVPRDIMVAGFDNIDIAIMTTPSITSINQPKQDMGFMACNQLLSMIREPQKEPQNFILDTELIIRESTGF